MHNPLHVTIRALGLIAGAALFSSSAIADETMTPLLSIPLEGMDGTVANMALVEVDPGFQTERHLHPGHVFIYVLEGAIEIELDGADPVRIGAGEAGYEMPNHPMVGRNVSATEGARFIVLQVGPEGAPLSVVQ